MIPLYLPTAASIVRTQSAKRPTLAVGAGRDGVADLDRTVGDDHAIDQQLEQRPLPAEVGGRQTLAHAAAERLGVGGQAGRLAPAPGLVLEVVLLAVQGLQPGFGVAPAALVLGQRNHAGEVGLGEPLDLLAQRGRAAAQRPGRGAGWPGAPAAPAAASARRAPAPSRARSSRGPRAPRTGRARPAPPARAPGRSGPGSARPAPAAATAAWSGRRSRRTRAACGGRSTRGGTGRS
jgi:hypothetical protein